MTRVLVTGGTGFIGSHLVEALILDGENVRCLVRKTSKIEHVKKLGVELVYGDITDRSSVNKAVEDIDFVYHLAGVLGQWGVPDELYWNTHVRGTENVVKACLNKDLKRFIHCSSAGVSGPIEKPPADETYPYKPSNIYERSKVEAEKIVLRHHHENDLPVTIVRPEFVYGPRDMHVHGLFKTIQKGRFPIIGNGSSFLHPTYIEDLIQGFKLCTGSKKAIGEIYIIAGERYVTVKELAYVIAKALDAPPPEINVPIQFAKVGAFVFEILAKIFKFQPPMTRSRVTFFTENYAFDISKARKELGYEPISLEEGIRRTVEWYVQYGYLSYPKTRDAPIKFLYSIASAEGQGLGTAYEYRAKWSLLRRAFQRVGHQKSTLISGLPEKYGTSMDFVLLAREYGHRITIVDEREEAVNRLMKSLQILGKEHPVDRIINVDELSQITPTHQEDKYDLLLCCEVLQRLSKEKRIEYLRQINKISRNAVIFVPNGENELHAKVSGLKTIGLNELLDNCKRQKCVILDKGYVDMPPFPPGLKMPKKEGGKIASALILGLLMMGLDAWCSFEKVFLKAVKKRYAHIVYVVLTSELA